MVNLYTFRRHSYGPIEIFNPDGESIAFIQNGDDVQLLEHNIQIIGELWEKPSAKQLEVYGSVDVNISKMLESYDPRDERLPYYSQN